MERLLRSFYHALSASAGSASLICWCLVVLSVSRICSAAEHQTGKIPSDRVHAFYYSWFGNPQTDGKYRNWNHPVTLRNGAPRRFPGGDDIGANFYPALGCYSSNDPAAIDTHMQQLHRAGVGVISVSWWGKDSYTDRTLPLLFRAAEKHGIKINFHIEPNLGPGGRSAQKVREAIVYLLGQFGQSPALHRDVRRGNRAVFYIYDSYHTKADEWATILAPDGEHTIRGTPDDSLVIGLWVKQDEASFFLDGHFDGLYTYFASDGFTYGSTWAHWQSLSDWARKHDKLFVPCVAPGYLDTRIRPANGRNTRNRDDGSYYDRAFEAALAVEPDYIGITSFNEWHEGTQIEPAMPKTAGTFRYEDYTPLEPTWYLDRTAYWVKQFDSTAKSSHAR